MSPETEEIYRRYLEPLPAAERVRLLARLAEAVVQGLDVDSAEETDLIDLEGLVAEAWSAAEAQAYVSTLREEWTPAR
jgi:hypothetical protein